MRDCVVTVPVYFDDRQRADVRRACHAAGMYVKAFVHEPFAAFVGHMGRERGAAANWDDIRNVLVFDWGGGTLDITLVSHRDGALYEQGTGGISDCAGDDFDQQLEQSLIQRFLGRHRLWASSLVLRPSVRDRLVMEAERRKVELSTEAQTEALLSDFYHDGTNGLFLKETITREEFEEMIRTHVASAMAEVDNTLERAGVSRHDVDQVLLIGGTSLIPMVGDELRKWFGPVRVVQLENAATVIAEGASIIAHHDWKPYVVYPLYVVLSDGTRYRLYDSGTPLWPPEATAKKVSFYCTDHREGEARLVVAEGKRTGDPQTKCVLPIAVDPALRHYRVERVHTEFKFDENMILHLEGYGSVKGEVSGERIYDLCIGLRTR